MGYRDDVGGQVMSEARTERALEALLRGQSPKPFGKAAEIEARGLIAMSDREQGDKLRLATVDGERIGELRATLRTSCRP